MTSAGQFASETRCFDLEGGNASATAQSVRPTGGSVSVVMDRRNVQGVQANEVSGLLGTTISLERMPEGTPTVFETLNPKYWRRLK